MYKCRLLCRPIRMPRVTKSRTTPATFGYITCYKTFYNVLRLLLSHAIKPNITGIVFYVHYVHPYVHRFIHP